MAEAEQPQQIPEAAYPAPPPFWRHFTLANEEELRKLEESSPEDQPPQKLPLHLAYLRPPPPPPATAEFYTTFGQKQVIDPTKPSSLPTDQLLFDPDEPNLNHAVLLSKLTKSLLLNFLELTSILSLDPTKHEEKMADIRQLVLNIHVVINIYRPHQARESVKEMLIGILEDGQREIDECDRLKERIEEFLSEVGQTESPSGDVEHQEDAGTNDEVSHDQMMEKQRNLWKQIQDMT
ncbi:Mediator of RNA polymerase II transcription subunit 7 [Cladophialophora carrionii]|uniref:Mediator of RNA polymerase II transcription subunit 7 n=1 Tax=Cladophialophora carrionii TaxID=86049 RepID=A0A1C1CYD7_9EURO|nr:Mediator of RNA polymerase II transcription subunit 7 [Cladophialophora carrionii]